MRGNPYYSQYRAAREQYDVDVLSVSTTQDGLGYLTALRRQLDGQVPLVMIRPLSALHWAAWAPLLGLRGATDLEWTADGRTLTWDLSWRDGVVITATVKSDGSWNAIRCTGLPPNRMIAYPDEIVRDSTGATARVLKAERSDAGGGAVIRLDGPLAAGEVVIGALESRVMEITDWFTPRVSFGQEVMKMSMRQVFATDFPDAFVEVDPWS
ncbi:hypothetical protein [Chachezhania sediminis]|uniref:hypothetical protein n=1 Tax=Chachezhania sediminis TaxID=2599291 RepID=UPI00131A6D05|nr:hypothetical protein [Chachezhania sediminis]